MLTNEYKCVIISISKEVIPLSKEYYTQNGEKIKVDDFGDVYGGKGKLGHIDKYGKFYSSQSDVTAKLDDNSNIVDGNGKTLGRIDGFNRNQIITPAGTSSNTNNSDGRITVFDKILSWVFGLVFSWKFWVFAWIVGMIICIASGDAPWD